MGTESGYQAGVCNIGGREVKLRLRFGQVALAVTVATTVLLFWMKVAPLWRLVLFLPAMSSASGYLQARSGFCSGFGAKGLSNFGAKGENVAVADEESRKKDRIRSRQINLQAALFGAAYAILAWALSLF
jgi:hypothetical protein